jgi:hypothetical protein
MSPFVSIFAAGTLGLMGAMRSRSHNPEQDELPSGNLPSPRSLASSMSKAPVSQPA